MAARRLSTYSDWKQSLRETKIPNEFALNNLLNEIKLSEELTQDSIMSSA